MKIWLKTRTAIHAEQFLHFFYWLHSVNHVMTPSSNEDKFLTIKIIKRRLEQVHTFSTLNNSTKTSL